jgi:hypothetical protein
VTIKHELWLTTDEGNRLDLLDEAESFDWSRVINGPGRCRVTLPGSFDRSLLSRDNRIEVWRAPEADAKLRLENIFFIRRIVTTTSVSGVNRIIVRGRDPTELLIRRIVAFAAATPQSKKTDLVDDMMKEIVAENLGASAGLDTFGASRSFDSSFFSVQPDAGLGPSITKSFSWRNVLAVLQDLSDAAREAGTEIYFAVIPTSTLTFEFQTFLDQPGQDRRFPLGSVPVIFSFRRDNIEDPFLEDDFEDELSYVYAGGQGLASARVIEEARDLDRINASIWNRREGFKDARDESAPAGVADDADAKLIEGRPRRNFSVLLLNSEGSRYGKDWDFGDRVTVEYSNEQFDGFVRAVTVFVDSDGKETVQGRVEISDVA